MMESASEACRFVYTYVSLSVCVSVRRVHLCVEPDNHVHVSE